MLFTTRVSQQRSPQDYFLLATLADLVQRNDASMFAKWLLSAIKTDPSDPRLQSLLGKYIQYDVPTKQSSAVLLSIAKVTDGGLFYRLTEPPWDHLLHAAPFELFAKTLHACTQMIRRKSPYLSDSSESDQREMMLCMMIANISSDAMDMGGNPCQLEKVNRQAATAVIDLHDSVNSVGNKIQSMRLRTMSGWQSYYHFIILRHRRRNHDLRSHPSVRCLI